MWTTITDGGWSFLLGGVEQTRTYLGRIRAEVQTPLKYKTKKNDKTCRIVEN